MKLGKVVGKIWATHKDPQLTGVKLYVLQPLNDDMQPVGTPIIAADAIGSGEGDFVFWVGVTRRNICDSRKENPV